MISSLEALAVIVALKNLLPKRHLRLKTEGGLDSNVDGQQRERVGIKQVNVDPVPG